MLAQQMQFMIPGTTMQPVVSVNSLLWELIVSLRKKAVNSIVVISIKKSGVKQCDSLTLSSLW